MPKTSNNKLIPQLVVTDAQKAIDFYAKVFGAKVDELKDGKDNIIYAKLLIGNDAIIIVDKKFMQEKPPILKVLPPCIYTMIIQRIFFPKQWKMVHKLWPVPCWII